MADIHHESEIECVNVRERKLKEIRWIIVVESPAMFHPNASIKQGCANELVQSQLILNDAQTSRSELCSIVAHNFPS